MTLEELQVVIEAQTAQFRSEIDKVQKQIKAATGNINKEVSKIKSIFASLGRTIGGLAIGKMLVDSTKSAMKVEGAIQQINRTMGESSNAFLKWGKQHGLAFNLAQSDIANYGAVYSNLLSGFMGSSSATMKGTQDLLKASSIIASGTGRSMTDVQERIRSGLLGNTEAIEDLGINVNVAMLESTDAFRRFAGDSSWNKLDFQTQQQIRLFSILEQTTAKFGDSVLNNTASSWQGFVAILKDIQLNLGQAFLPIMNVVLPILSNLAMAIRTVTAHFAVFMQTLFGKPMKTPSITSTMNTAKSSAIGATGAQDGYSDSIGRTGDTAKKTAKEMNRLLGGFDEINSIKDSGADGGGALGGAGGGGIGDMGGIPDLDFGLDEEIDTSAVSKAAEKVKSILASIFEPFENAWKSQGAKVLETFNKMIDTTLGLLRTLGEGLAYVWDNGGSKLVEGLVTLGLQLFQIAGYIYTEFIGPIVDGLIKLLSPAIAFVIDMVANLVKGLTKLIDWLLGDGKPVLDTIIIVLGSFALAWGIVTLAVKIAQGAVIAWNIICALSTVATTAFGIAIAFLTSPIGIAIIAIGSIIAIGVLLYRNWDWLCQKATEIWDSIKSKFTEVLDNMKVEFEEFKVKILGIWDSIKGKFDEFKNWLGNVFATDWSKQFGVFGNILNNFLATVKSIFDSVKRVFSGIVDFIVGVFTGNWSRAWEGVKNIFSGVWNTLEAVAKAPLNAVIRLVNRAIGGINELLSFKVPDWIPGIGGKSVGFTIPNIPQLARGGIVDSAQMFIAGEAGREVVMPLENNTGWITDLAQKVSSRMPEGRGDNSSISGDIIFQIDGSVIGRVALAQLRKMQRQGGITLIPV